MSVYSQYAEEVPGGNNKFSFVSEIYNEMNSWWNFSNDILNYLFSTIVLMVGGSIASGILISIIKLLFNTFSGRNRRRYR